MRDTKSQDELQLLPSEGEHSPNGLGSPRKKQGFLCGDLFPTFFTFVIFIAYVSLFVNQGILVTATKNAKNSYDYSIVAVVFLTEFGKLIVSISIYLFEKRSVRELIDEIASNYKLCLWYFVPSGLYCLYNNLSFLNLAWYDPTTYFILLQIRVLLTGATFQVVFRKRLTMMQWFSLIVLTMGCVIKQVNFASTRSSDTKDDGAGHSESSDFSSVLWRTFFNVHFILMMVQVLCSCFAGVYNEYLLKEKGNNTHIMIQNVFMYVDSCFCNILVLLYFGSGNAGSTEQAMSWSDSFFSILKPLVICIILNNCAVGVVTSVFLKHLNSILKVFASAVELAFTAVLSWILFGIAINWSTTLAIMIICVAMYIYTVNPVINLPQAVTVSSPRISPKHHEKTMV